MLTTVAGGWVGYFSNLKSALYTPTYMHNALVFFMFNYMNLGRA